MKPLSAISVPTVPTVWSEVGTDQAIDINSCSDRSYCSDQFGHGGEKKEKSLSGLVARLRQRRDTIGTFETRHVHTNPPGPSNFTRPIPLAVGTVGTVGTVNVSGCFGLEEMSEQGSEQSEHPPSVPAGELTAWLRKGDALAAGRDASAEVPSHDEHLANLPEDALPPMAEKVRRLGDSTAADPADDWFDDPDAGTIAIVEQLIPHHVMVAGLLAASRMRPAADPWEAGVARVRRMPPLDGFSLAQWSQIGTDAADLLRTCCHDMRRLGWTAEDAFGIHPDVLGRAVRAWGLAVLLNGARVVDMTEAGAVIEKSNGVRQSFTRSSGMGAVPLWEISQ